MKNADEPVWVAGPEFEMSVADKNVQSEHQQQKRIKPRKSRPEKRRYSPNNLTAGYHGGVVVVNDKSAKHEEQCHPEP